MRESQRPRRRDWQDTNRAINRFFAYLIPIALLGAAGYSVWVIVIVACGLAFYSRVELSSKLT